MFLVKPVYGIQSDWCGIQDCGSNTCTDDCVVQSCDIHGPTVPTLPTD